MELLVGCGNNREKKFSLPEMPKAWSGDLITLDWDDTCRPDVVHDLNNLPYPFDDNQFDEIHAYEVLEHCGTQGDYRFFFDQFSEFHRILKPGGYFVGSCPNWDSPWAWGDPGHTRIISPECMIFLVQSEYDTQLGKTAMTDYRFCYEADFHPVAKHEMDHSWVFMMRAVKDGYKPEDN